MKEKFATSLYEELASCFAELRFCVHQSLGLAVLLAYPDGRLLTEPSGLCPFCTLINLGAEGRARCAKAREASVKAVAAAGREIVQTCYAGLMYLGMPLMINGQTMAVILCGNVARQPLSAERLTALARELWLDPQELRSAGEKVPIWGEDRLRAAVVPLQKAMGMITHLLYTKQVLERKANELGVLFEFGRAVSTSLEVG